MNDAGVGGEAVAAAAVAATCPRCGAGFGCGAGAAVPCACSTLALSAALLAALRARYAGCLCMRCLGELAAADARAAAGAAADRAG